MAMDAKDLRIESALGGHSEDGNTKYTQNGTAFHANGNKPYHDIGSNSLAKVDVPTSRPCAIIGPDRVVPPQSTHEAYLKKAPVEPWPCSDSIYQHPSDYLYKPTEYQLSRNISPRQTFQENMQRIMVPPSYASVKNSEDHGLKNPKLIPLESKFSDVPYAISPINNELKTSRTPEGVMPNNKTNQPVLSHGWASDGVNVRPLRPYGAPELYQYTDYPNFPGPRPVSMIRPHRNIHEDLSQVYQDRFHEANLRFKPYSTTKERSLQNPQTRYDYIPNYPNAFHPHASYPAHKYELQKSISTHPYSVYPQVPLKLLDRRMPPMEKYPRSPNQQVNFSQSFCNQNIPSTYGTVPGNCVQNRSYPYATDPSTKSMIQSRLYFDSNNAPKYYTGSENMFMNDINRPPTIKNDLLYPPYPPMNIHSLPPHHMYRKESSLKRYEHPVHYRNIEYSANGNPLGRLPLQFSPQMMSLSPSDSITSNDPTSILGNVQDDCGYASQSSTTSIRSVESAVNRISSDIYRRHDMTMSQINKFKQKSDTSTSSKDKKDINVRQFLQMWNEGDDEGNDNKEITRQRDSNSNNSLAHYESGNNQEQLYVLGLVNVPKEEIGKYDHIQKISKLPENIKGYNSIELLNQYEKLVELPGLHNYSLTPSQTKPKDLNIPLRSSIPRNGTEVSSARARPISPLDVEAKISQSVIHKEVGCNFEIRPCSPQMLNVELATPVHNVLGERLIEKVVNPVKTKSPMHQRIETNNNSSLRSSPKVPSCKMANNQYPSPNVNDSLKTNYCLQDLESNSGVCLASLPRLDNDIELNFPEINQQFINANKISSIRDLPNSDTENSGNAHKSKNKIHNQPFTSENLNSGSESDKDILKLSKYRKHKRNSVPNDNDDTSNVSLHRTDSVIIKNPDNTKSQEDCLSHNVTLINNDTPTIGNIVNPVNTVVENDTAINYSQRKFTGTVNENFNDCTSCVVSDTAIDFSLNKIVDEQSNSITSLSHLSDALQNDIDIDKSIYMNNQSINNNAGDLYIKNIPNQLKTVSSDKFSTLQPKSPVLNNLTCSTELNSNIALQSIPEDNIILQPHETVITYSKPKELVSDVSLGSVSSLTEEIASHDDLPSLDSDKENIAKSTYIINIPENDIALSTNLSNQALNYSLSEHLDDVIAPVCKDNFSLVLENQTNNNGVQNIVEDNNSNSPLDENDTFSSNGVTQKDPHIHTENSSVDYIVTQQCDKNKIQTNGVAQCNPFSHPDIVTINSSVDESGTQQSNDEKLKKKTAAQSNPFTHSDINTKKSIIEELVTHQSNYEKIGINGVTQSDPMTHSCVVTKNNNVDDLVTQKSDDEKSQTNDISLNDSITHSDTYNNNSNLDDFVTQQSNNEKVPIVPIESESKINEDITNTIVIIEKEIFGPKIENEHERIDFKTADNLNFTIQCRNENDVGKETNNIKVINTKPYNSVNPIRITNNDFDSTNIPFTNADDLIESNNLLSNTETNYLTVDIKTKTEISTPLNIKNARTDIIESDTKSYQFHNKVSLNKELFSPRLQNLLIHNEGLCILKTNKIKETWKANFDNNKQFDQLGDDLKLAVKPNIAGKNVDLEFKNSSNINTTNRNIDESSSKVKTDDSADFLQNETIIAESKNFVCDTNIINCLNEAQTEEIMSKSVKDKVHTESCVVDNYTVESLLEKAEKETNDTVPENNIEMNFKFNHHVKEKNTEHLLCNQLSDKRTRTLKRSLSESAVTAYVTAPNNIKGNYDNDFSHDRKRLKIADSEILVEPQLLTENLTTFIQSNRRNSISTTYNEENVSFCIFIDNECVLTEENENCQKICYTEISDECITTICSEEDTLNSELTAELSYENPAVIHRKEEPISSVLTENFFFQDNSICLKTDDVILEIDPENIPYEEPKECANESDLILQNMNDRTIQETWVEDVACMETVFSDDIAEDIIISAPSSPKEFESSEDESGNINLMYNVNENEHTNKVKHIYGNQMCDDDAQLVEKLYRTPQMDVNKTLIDRESHLSQEYSRYYDNESLEKILSESNTLDMYSTIPNNAVPDKSLVLSSSDTDVDVFGNKENLKEVFLGQKSNKTFPTIEFPNVIQSKLSEETKSNQYDDCLAQSCESSYDNFVSYKKEEKLQYTISSSPEVSSTTSEEKAPGILLKIRSYKGSKISEVNDMNASFNATHSQRHKNNNLPTSRPLITKGAQKYIPPIKETIRDLKVKIRLPKQSLYKLQQLKKSKEEPKIKTSHSKHYIKNLPQGSPKKTKPKPKFEDVLMSIDEMQFKKHKAMNKKPKQSVPKVIIKKNENGAHYASTQTNETFNPDLTGRKWQPWVFLEKSNFVDKMALKQKFKAVYNHRKKTFVLAENFRKYKSISNAKFVISHPKTNNISTGKLKYTFRLKHN